MEQDLKGIALKKVLTVVKDLCEDKRKKFIGHNVKYDYVLLRRNGIHLKSVFFDTMLAASECFGDLDFLNLGFLAEKILGKRIQSYREALGERHSPWDIPLSKLASHACKDAETTMELYTALLRIYFISWTSLKELHWSLVSTRFSEKENISWG